MRKFIPLWLRRAVKVAIAEVKLAYIVPRDRKKQQLLLVLPWMEPGGGEKVSLDLVSGIDKDKYEIHIIKTLDSSSIWESRFRKHVSHIWHFARLLPPDIFAWYIRRVIRRLRIRTMIIASSVAAYEKLAEIKREFPDLRVIDILHSEGSPEEQGGFPSLAAKYDKYISRHIVISRYLKQLLQSKYGIAPEKVVTIYNPVDLSLFTRQPVSSNSSKLHICYVGRFSSEKHPETLVKVADELVNKRGYTDLQFTFAGDGYMLPDIKQEVARLQLSKYVDLPGFIDDVPQFLADKDVLLITSEIEGIPLVVVEAMAMQVVVISTNVGAVSEAISPNKTGMLVSYAADTHQQIADKLEKLINSPQLQLELSSAARKLVEERFSLQNFIASYQQEF